VRVALEIEAVSKLETTVFIISVGYVEKRRRVSGGAAPLAKSAIDQVRGEHPKQGSPIEAILSRR